MSEKRVIFVGRKEAIEPLGILHLACLAKEVGWNSQVHLVQDSDLQPLLQEVDEWKPDLVAFSVWTGWHKPAFQAADRVRSLGIPVAIGGPHATYFTEDCAEHADWVVKAAGFRMLKEILLNRLPPGTHFDRERMAGGFPVPDRKVVYERYPHLANSPIKSVMCTVGCPFFCSYCYAPENNRLYGGFKLSSRTVDDVIQEALYIRDNWPLQLIYMQDDIWGFNVAWLEEFAAKWPKQVGTPIHCQIRLELAEGEIGNRRLDLFREAGVTGITLAVEHGNDWMRRFVLHRPMADELIYEGIQKIKSRGFTLRTEQIYAVSLSDIWSDLEILKLNVNLNPDMMWSSILAPYLGTEMGDLATALGLYRHNNDDLSPSFFERSVMNHVQGGRRCFEPVVADHLKDSLDNPLSRMQAKFTDSSRQVADIYLADDLKNGGGKPLTQIRYLDADANARYSDQAVMLHELSYWLAKVHDGHRLAERFVFLPKSEWTWKRLGQMTSDHLDRLGMRSERLRWRESVSAQLARVFESVPKGIEDNLEYFAYLPAGAELAQTLESRRFFDSNDWRVLATATRHHLFERALYKVKPAAEAIAKR